MAVSYTPKDGETVCQHYSTFGFWVTPLDPIMPPVFQELDPMTGRLKTWRGAQQFSTKFFTNEYVDALQELIAVRSGNKSELSTKSRECLQSWASPDFVAQKHAALASLTEDQRQQFVKDMVRLYSRGPHVHKVTYAHSNPTEKVEMIVDRGGVAVPGKPHSVFPMGADVPVRFKFSNLPQQASSDALVQRDDHTVLTFAGQVDKMLEHLKAVSPTEFWKPQDPARIQTKASPFITAVQQGDEGNNLNPFIYLLPNDNAAFMALVRGESADRAILGNQIALGFSHSGVYGPETKAVGQVQHTALEVMPGKLAEAIALLHEGGIQTLSRPTDPDYYRNVKADSFVLFLPHILSVLKVDPALYGLIGDLTNYGFQVKGETFEKLLSQYPSLTQDLVQKARGIFEILAQLKVVFSDPDKLVSELVAESITVVSDAMVRLNGVLDPTTRSALESNFSRILETILPRISDAESVGHYMEFVLQFHPDSGSFGGGLLSQTFTHPLAASIGRFHSGLN